MNAPAPPQHLDPIAARDRIALLDVLRGFALYGVLLANTAVWFSGRAFVSKETLAALHTRLDEVARFLIRVLVDGKAMTLFSFLFGLGFAVQLERAGARGRDGLAPYLRRLGILAGIGVLHIVLLWWGDILWAYALTGFFMVLFRRRSTRALVFWGVFLAFVPQIVGAIPAVAAFFDGALPHPADHEAFRAQMLEAIRGHDRLQLVRMHARQAFYHPLSMPLSFIPWTLGRFLLGYAAGRARLLHDVAGHRTFLRRLLAGGLLLGVPCSVAAFVKRSHLAHGGVFAPGLKLALMIPDELAVLALAATAGALFALAMERPAWARRLTILAPAGQMALTNYLSQSLICTFLFYGWGLGWVGHVGLALCIPLTLAIFALQIFVSRAWLRRFRFGPMEWLWRSLSYGELQPMRRIEPA